MPERNAARSGKINLVCMILYSVVLCDTFCSFLPYSWRITMTLINALLLLHVLLLLFIIISRISISMR